MGMNRTLVLLEGLGLIFILHYQQAESVLRLDDLENVVTLTADNFDKELAKNHLVVLFYGSGCDECDKLALTWKELAENIHKNQSPNRKHRIRVDTANPGISISMANCSNERRLCTNKYKCSIYEYRKCIDGPDTNCNMDGEYLPRKWMPTIADAKNLCEQKPDCQGITRDKTGYEPRRGPNVGVHPEAHEVWLLRSETKGMCCFKSYENDVSCTCPNDCNATTCENSTPERFAFEGGYPMVMFFKSDQNTSDLHLGPKDLNSLIEFVNDQVGRGPPIVKSQSVLLMEAGCKKQEWEMKNGIPFQYHWNRHFLPDTFHAVANTFSTGDICGNVLCNVDLIISPAAG